LAGAHRPALFHFAGTGGVIDVVIAGAVERDDRHARRLNAKRISAVAEYGLVLNLRGDFIDDLAGSPAGGVGACVWACASTGNNTSAVASAKYFMVCM
jgi:hypothetical protein